MADLRDVSNDMARLQDNLDGLAQQLLSAASARIAARATGTYMSQSRGGGPTRHVSIGPLRIVSGRLARSLTGARFTSGMSQFRGGDFTLRPTGVGFRSAPLARTRVNITGASEGINQIERTGSGWRLTKGSRVPYAAIHEFGGSIRITPRMRRFFWARFMETEDRLWKALALTKKTHIHIPERSYLRAALRDELPRIQEMAQEGLTVTARETLSS